MAAKKGKSRKNRKEEILSAALSLIAQKGPGAATTRSIASLAGVTEGAIYRHFPDKDTMFRSIYERILLEMVQAKEKIVAGSEPLEEKIGQWIRVTYDYFDEQPEAFIFLYLTPHSFNEENGRILDRQGDLFMEIVQKAQAKGQARPMDPAFALSLFTGIELNVPRLIHEKRLAPPARGYIDAVKEAVLRVLI